MNRIQIPDTRPLFRPLYDSLYDLLDSIDKEEWFRPTIARAWQVKDVTAHLLDGDLRRLSMGRDGYYGEVMPRLDGFAGTVSWLNGLNADWVKAMKRVSPDLLIGLMKFSGPQIITLFENLEPDSEALFPVAWAGEEASKMRFDIAREYTERWLHQQQIRHALGRSPLYTDTFLHPLIDTFLMALPWRYHPLRDMVGKRLRIMINGESTISRDLINTQGEWALWESDQQEVDTSIVMNSETAWQLFSKGINPQQARTQVQITGNYELAEPVLYTVSVMA